MGKPQFLPSSSNHLPSSSRNRYMMEGFLSGSSIHVNLSFEVLGFGEEVEYDSLLYCESRFWIHYLEK